MGNELTKALPSKKISYNCPICGREIWVYETGLDLSGKPCLECTSNGDFTVPSIKEVMKTNIESGVMKNGLVLIICIAEYQNCNDLHGVKADLKRYRDLWENKYDYQVYPKKYDKYDSKFFWTRAEIIQFIEEHREYTLKNHHDGLIIIHRGHGGSGVILSSDGYQIKITKLHDKVSGSWKEEIRKIPRIFIVDACRGGRSVSDEKQAQDSDQSSHPRSNLVTIYGNPDGYVTWVDTQKGGWLSQVAIRIFEKYATSGEEFMKLVKMMGNSMQKLFGDEQMVIYDGDATLCDLKIKPR